MFLRKLISSNSKITWAFIDLIMIIIGVYCAYLIQQYAEGERVEKEKEKIYSALKYELEYFRIFLPGRSSYASNRVEQWMQTLENSAYNNFSDWIFIEPQRSYQIIEYTIGIQDNNIVDFQLVNALQRLYVRIKNLEHAERLIMETSLRYLPVDKSMGSTQVETRNRDNMENFKRFIRFSKSRAESLGQVAVLSKDVLTIIDERLGPTKRKELELDLIGTNIGELGTKVQATGAILQFFPHLTKEEIEAVYDEIVN